VRKFIVGLGCDRPTHPFGQQAFKGAEFGWAKMLKQLTTVVASGK